jgi:alcohol dehydrogenase YqhD (iron-dependent ADH family)
MKDFTNFNLHLYTDILFDRVVKTLKDEGLDFVEFGGVQPNPLFDSHFI